MEMVTGIKIAKRLSNQNIKDIFKIHGTTKRRTAIMIDAYKNYVLSPYKNWGKILKELNLNSKTKILDLACGNGRTTVDISKKYKARVVGTDIVLEYLKFAEKYASEKGVIKLCKFIRMDARKAVSYFKDYDIVFWLSAPHLWGGADKIMKEIRKPCKNGGYILVYDAYYLPNSQKKKDSWYSLDKTTKKFEMFGDRVIKIFDERNYMWKSGYKEDRKMYEEYLKRIKDQKIVSIVNQQLKTLDRMEKWETKNFGTAFWIIQVDKKKKKNKV